MEQLEPLTKAFHGSKDSGTGSVQKCTEKVLFGYGRFNQFNLSSNSCHICWSDNTFNKTD